MHDFYQVDSPTPTAAGSELRDDSTSRLFKLQNIHYQFLLMYEYNILVKVTNNFVHDMPSFIPQYFRNSCKSHGKHFGASFM